MAAGNEIDLDYRSNPYTTGINLFCDGARYHNQISINKFIDLEMQQFTHRTHEAGCLETLEGDHVRFLHSTDAPETIGCINRPARRNWLAWERWESVCFAPVSRMN